MAQRLRRGASGLGELIVTLGSFLAFMGLMISFLYMAMSQVGSLEGNFTIGPGDSLIMVLQANRDINITGIMLRYDIEYVNACSLVKVYINGAPAPPTPPWHLKKGWSAIFVFNSTNYKLACTLVDEVDFLVAHNGRVEWEGMIVRFPSFSASAYPGVAIW
jgi:hypothetical protein